MEAREEIFKYVKDKYKIEPDYPFPSAPSYPVLRHSSSRKWFALIMDIPKRKLGLDGTESMLADILVRQPGYFYGYHITRSSWISILLDGTVPFAEIFRWIDESYAVTAPKKTGKRR